MNNIEISEKQKLEAMANKFYSGMEWNPKVNDYYTTARADLEVFKVLKIEDGYIYTVMVGGNQKTPEKWDLNGFTTEGFGPNRVHIQPWVLAL